MSRNNTGKRLKNYRMITEIFASIWNWSFLKKSRYNSEW